MSSPNLPDRPEPIANRILESGARLILSSFGPAGAILAEAVSFARSIDDDGQVAKARAALEHRLGTLDERLARLEQSGQSRRVTGERAQILAIAIRQANEHTVSYSEADDTIKQLGISAGTYREGVQELAELGLAIPMLNGNHASGFDAIAVPPAVFVELIGQVIPEVVVERELGEILDMFRRAEKSNWVRREEFEALPIAIPRLQHMLEYLRDQGLIQLDDHADSVERLMFANAQLLARGRRVLRGDEGL